MYLLHASSEEVEKLDIEDGTLNPYIVIIMEGIQTWVKTKKENVGLIHGTRRQGHQLPGAERRTAWHQHQLNLP